MQASLPWNEASTGARVRSLTAGFRVGGPYALSSLVALLATQTWFHTGTFIATGDVAPFLRTNLSAELSTVWGHSLSGAGSPSFQPLTRWPELAMLGFARLTGASPMTAQRWFYSLLAVAAVVGAVWFVSAFVEGPFARAFAGLVAFFNPFVLQHLPNPLPLWSIAIMGLAGGLVVRAARGRSPAPVALAGVSVFAAYLAVNPPLLAIAALWVVGLAVSADLFAGRGGTRAALAYLVRALPWALVLNAWWVVPYAFTLASQGTGYIVQAQTNVVAWSWTQVRLSPANVASLDGHWGWVYPEYFPYAAALDRSIWGPLRFGLPGLALAAPVLARTRVRRSAIVFIVAAVVLIFLAKGLHAPFSGANLFLYDHMPGMWLLREPMSKLGPALVLVYAVLAAVTLEGAARFIARSTGTPRAVIAVSVAVLSVGAVGFAYPMWTGQVIPDARPVLPSAHVALPSGWTDLAATLNAAPDRGKALVLPLDDFYQVPTTWGYYGVDQIPRSLLARPTIQSLPGSYYGDVPAFGASVRQLQTALMNGDHAAVPSLLESLGVTYVIVRHDLDPTFPHRHLVSPDRLTAALRSTAMVHPDGSFGVADLYRFDAPATHPGGPDPLIAGGDPVGMSTSDPVDLALASSAAPIGTTLISDLTGAAPADLPGAVVADPGSGVTTFTTSGGELRLTPRLVAPQLLHVRVRRRRSHTELVLQRATTVRLDNHSVFGGALGDIRLPGSTRVAAVSSDAGTTPMVNGTAVLGFPRSGSLSVWSPSGPPLALRGGTAVHDCHAYDGRSIEGSGIAARPLPGAETGIELAARSHTACVGSRAAIRIRATPILVGFDYRSLAGRPARACLWQEAVSLCAPMPPLDPTPGWHTYRAVVTPDSEVNELSLFLYADGDALGGVTTRTQYRSLTLQPLERVATRRLDVTLPTSTTLSAAPGEHQLRLATRAPASLAPLPFVVQDCHAYDSRSIEEAGLGVQTLPGEVAPAVRLTAQRHSACVSAPVAGFIAGGSYELSFDARTLQGLPARVCLWEDGPDRCAPIPALEASPSWRSVRVGVTPDAGTVGLRLFVYADGGATGGDGTVVEYRALRVAPAAPFGVAMLDLSGTNSAPPISWTRLGEATYQVDVSAASKPFVLSLAESYASGWKLEGVPQGRSVQHLIAGGYANGWLIGAGDAFTARLIYAPDRGMRAAAVVSLFGLLAIPPSLVRRRRRGRQLDRDEMDTTEAEPDRGRGDETSSSLQAPWSPPWW